MMITTLGINDGCCQTGFRAKTFDCHNINLAPKVENLKEGLAFYFKGNVSGTTKVASFIGFITILKDTILMDG
jgi:hypothetical protein